MILYNLFVYILFHIFVTVIFHLSKLWYFSVIKTSYDYDIFKTNALMTWHAGLILGSQEKNVALCFLFWDKNNNWNLFIKC